MGARTVGRWRLGLLLAGLLVLLAMAASAAVRAALLGHVPLASATLLVLLFVPLLPERRFAWAIPLGAAALLALRAVSDLKAAVIGLPVSYLDLVNVASDPLALLHALGVRSHGAVWGLGALAVAGAALSGLRAGRTLSLRKAGVRLCEAAAVLGLGILAVGAVARDMRDRLPELLPAVQGDLWQPSGQQRLAHAAGPLEYLAFTRLAGDAQAADLDIAAVPEPPAGQVESAAMQVLGPRLPWSALPPNLVVVHAESSFDPNAIFGLAEPVALPLWTAGPDSRALWPLRVNVVGGGSWVTEFEVLTGVDARSFGYQGFYTHQMIGPRVGHGFPAYLAQRGYDTAAYYTESAEYFGAGAAFANYGVGSFHDAASLGLAPDWSDSDLAIVQKAIAHGAFAAGDRPFFRFIGTNENHGPHPCRNFHGPGDLAVRFAAEASFEQACALNEYVLRARSTSRAVEAILEEMRRIERETGRPFAVLVYGDHQPYSFTDGFYSVAGGVSQEGDMPSLGPFRTGPNEHLTFFHLLSSIEGGGAPVLGQPVPATMIPTLLSAYVASGWQDLYLPVNLLAYLNCGSDVRDPGCALARDMDLWGRAAILSDR